MADVAVVFEGGLARTLAVLPLLIAISIAGCGSKGSAVGHKAQRSLVAGGCGATRLYLGSPPAWTAAAFSDSSNPPPPIPYGIADGGDAVAVVFGYPLRAR